MTSSFQSNIQSIKALYLIDGRISLADRARLVAGLPADGAWAVLTDDRDGLVQIQEVLANYSGLNALHLIGHGSPGSVLLGATTLGLATIGQHAAQLAQIGAQLGLGGDILLYGCNVAQSKVGQSYIEQLAKVTGADIAASVDRTGEGGNWTLEAATGAIESTPLNIPDFESTLDTVGVTRLSTVSRKPTLTGSVSLSAGRTLEIELGGKVYKAGDGKLSVSNGTWSLTLAAETNDLEIASYDVKARVVDDKPAAPVVLSTTASNLNAVNHLSGTNGNDSIVGRSDTRSDVAVFTGNRSDYTITATTTGITDKRTGASSQGTDTLTDLNQLKFADGHEFVLAASQRVALTGTETGHNIAVTASKLYNGTKAAETFVVGKGVSAMILAGAGDTVDLSGRITDYTYTAKGSQLQISDGAYTTTINIGDNVTLRTASGSTAVTLAFNSGVPQLKLGTQVVGATNFDAAAAITANSAVSGNAQTIVTDTDTAELVVESGVDTTPPTIAISASSNNLSVGQTETITFTLSEVSTNFTAADIAVTGGTLSALSGSGTSYSATFTPAANSTAAALIGVASGKFSDAAGNLNTDGGDANNSVAITVNTVAADTTAPTIALTSSKGSLSAGQTATITFTLSEASANFTADDITCTGGTLSGFIQNQSNPLIYTAVFAPSENSTTAGVISVASSKFSDPAGNQNADGTDTNNRVNLTVNTVASGGTYNVDVAENELPGTVVYTPAVTAGATYTLTGTDSALMYVDPATGQMAFRSMPNYESGKTSYSVTLNKTVSGATTTKSLLFNVLDGNDPLTALALTNTTTALNENIDNTNRIKVADIAITDDAFPTTYDIFLTGTDKELFEVDPQARALYLKAGAQLNYEAQASYAVTVNVTESPLSYLLAASKSAAFSMTVTNVNEAPTDIKVNALVTSVVAGANATRTKVADIVVTDDALGANTLSLVGADASFFELDAPNKALYLKSGISIDANKGHYDVAISVADSSLSTPALAAGYSLKVKASGLEMVVQDLQGNQVPMTLNQTGVWQPMSFGATRYETALAVLNGASGNKLVTLDLAQGTQIAEKTLLATEFIVASPSTGADFYIARIATGGDLMY
jgi:hypothetical protein